MSLQGYSLPPYMVPNWFKGYLLFSVISELSNMNPNTNKHVKCDPKIKQYHTKAEMEEDQVSQAVQTHNTIAAQNISRRKPIRIQNNTHNERMNKVRQRLLKKLAKKKAQK